MSTPKVYIDGQSGTTGIRIREMLEARSDIELMLIPEADRRDSNARAEYLNACDLTILCLPDDAAAEAVSMIDNPQVRVIDTSTERRTDPNWVYGLPELNSAQRDRIRASTRVANPGCYPQSVILGLRPLIDAGALPAAAPYTVNAVSGYSGGGKNLIESYEASGIGRLSHSLYALGGGHKHLPEMRAFSGIRDEPLFVPSVDHSFAGMLVSVPLPAAMLGSLDKSRICDIWQERYQNEPFVRPILPQQADSVMRDGKFLELDNCNGTNSLELFVFGNEAQGLIVVGRLDNLGKGASGNAVQCMNLMLGFEECAGLRQARQASDPDKANAAD